jgi:GT2 family glycosyltransferase
MQALDGLLLATRRGVAQRVGFDAATFDGFHFYDLDFTYRAHLLGLRLAVTTDVIAVHASTGNFGEAWQRYVERFRAKFPALVAPAGKHHAYGERFRTPGEVVRFYDALRGLGAAA